MNPMEKKSEISPEERKGLLRKMLVRFAFFFPVMGVLILLPAGTFNYWQFYVFCGLLMVPMLAVLFYFMKNDPKFLERRSRAREKEKAQVLISILSSVIFLAGFIIPGLDKRFGWSQVPVHIILLACVAILLGYLIIFMVFRQNSYASRVIEVDEEQEVISTGLYAIVRHPMYMGVLIMYIPTPVALGSYWGLIPFALLPLSLVLRLLNEEKVLKENLKGYKEYCQKTRYRLIPYIW
jgi:protein-S-isoprenylcysteine O-methyltransferase Ste14